MSSGLITEDYYWSFTHETLLARLRSAPNGLSEAEAADRLSRYGLNAIAEPSGLSALRLLARQFRSALVLILLGACIVAGIAGDWTGTIMILVVLTMSAAMGFAQEFRASRALEVLRNRMRVTCRIRRNGAVQTHPMIDVVPGDIVELSAGSLVPADGVILEARDCFALQSVLTGESAPVEKTAVPTAAHASVTNRTNVLFMGTSLRSGTATMLVMKTGRDSLFGGIADHLKLEKPETDFERGIRHFSTLLAQFVLVLTIVVMSINLLLGRSAIESILFAIALAVGITPELLPAIVTFTLARGARQMAGAGVLVRRLAAIENLGSMTVLCSDKTGTLTSGATSLVASMDAQGANSERVLRWAVINARLQTGLANPLDEVILQADTANKFQVDRLRKLDERPYDFVRKRISVTVADDESGAALTITKGALNSVLEICTNVRAPDSVTPLQDAERVQIRALAEGHARNGCRVLALATVESASAETLERNMIFEGLLLFEDPTKPDIKRTLQDLKSLGVRLKIVTGDSRYTARHVAEAVGMTTPRVITGEELQDMRDEALWHQAQHLDVFAEVDPNQKERIILALRKSSNVVGYLGDGINDAPALHAADVGISVDGAVDVAKEAADIVLLEHDLKVINQGIRSGRATFANTQKYIFSTTSANFGNMLSMAAAAAFLPFLPLLAPQILLNNLLSDIPSLALANDRVDPEAMQRPPRWSMRRIRKFTIVFGAVSSAFDLLTFGVLLKLFGDRADIFRSGWFLESLATEVFVLLVLRTRRSIFASVPKATLVALTFSVLAGAVIFVQSPWGRWMGFVSLPANALMIIAGITALYVGSVELTKRLFWADGYVRSAAGKTSENIVPP